MEVDHLTFRSPLLPSGSVSQLEAAWPCHGFFMEVILKYGVKYMFALPGYMTTEATLQQWAILWAPPLLSSGSL